MAVSLEVIRKLTVQASAQGVDAVRAQLEAVDRAQQGVAKSADQMRVSNDNAAKSTLSVAKQFDALERAIDPVARANARLAADQLKVTRALNEGAIGADRAANVISLLGKRHEEAIAKTSAHTSTLALNRAEWINLGRQMQDVGVSLYSGQAPLTVLVQQGAQIADVFGSSRGGAGASLKQFGAVALSVVTHPLTMLVAGIGVATIAALEFEQQQNSLERALNGVGRAAGMSSDELRRVGARGAADSGIGAGEGIRLAANYASSGINGRNIGTLVEDTQRFSRAFGVDMEKAQTEIGQIVSESGLGAFEKRFGAASFAEKELVRSLEASGRFIEAQAEKTRLFDGEIRKAKDTSSELAKIWEKITTWATTPMFGLGETLGRLKNGPSLQEQLTSARGDYFYLHAQRRGQASYYPGEADAEARVHDLEKRIEDERQNNSKKLADIDLNRRSQIAGGIVDELSPDATRLRGLNEKRNALKPFLDSQEALGKLGERAGDAREALDRLNAQISGFETGLQRIVADSALAVRETEAYTFAQRASVAAEKALLEARRAGKTEVEQAASVEAARNRLIAEGNRKASDTLRSANDNLSLVGLSPYERAMKEIDIKYRDLREQSVPTGPLQIGFAQAGDAATKLADALTGAASRISGVGIGASAPSFAGAGSAYDPRGISGYIGARAAAYGIDPTIALRVARSEGLGTFTGDAGSSYGAFQLHRGGIARGGNAVPGLGDDFFKATGLDPANPANERATIDYALKWASQHGWGAFHGAARAGIGNFQGIGGVGGLKSTASDDLKSAEAVERRAKAYELIDDPLKKVNEDIDRQRALLDAQWAAFGKSTEETARAAKEQELLNQFQQQGVPITDKLRASVGETARNYGALAQAQEDVGKKQRDLVAGMDEFRGTSKEAIGSLISDLRQGQRFGDALASSLDQVANKLISISLDKMISGAFGESGKSGGGLFGNSVGGFLKGIFGFEDGGIMTSRGPIPLRRYADGGIASSPQLALFGEGSGPEAYVPLKNGGIPVHIRMAREAAQASASSNQVAVPNTEVHVHNAPPGTQTKESQTSAGGRRVDVMFADAVGGALQTGAGRRGLAMATSRPVQR